ncbi:MAG TPA: ATP-binding protein [Anaerolineales bacterium]|nr:ATP-binding protein [Anaerolineales bacterium]
MMTDYFRRYLGAKLLLSYLAIVVVGVLVLIVASQFVLPGTFSRHMSGMGMMNGMMNGMLEGQNTEQPAGMSQIYSDFRASFNEALGYATLAAIIAAIALSLYLSSSITAPVKAMSLATQHIADGHYKERVPVRGEDELAQLAMRFNQMAEKLDQVELMRRQLIGDVSHELRTPLTAIKGSMEGLIDGVLPATEETFQQIHAETDRLNRLVNDLQELSRVEAHAYELNLQLLDVASLVNTVAKRLSSQIEAKQIVLRFELAPDLPQVVVDPDRAIQILTNLVANAVQYTSDAGRILISAKPTNGEVQISVQDTGIGIPKEHLPHIFDRFYRVDKSRSRRAGGGSGIGLTIARALVEVHGGRIWVESAGEGRGSIFTFTLKKAG